MKTSESICKILKLPSSMSTSKIYNPKFHGIYKIIKFQHESSFLGLPSQVLLGVLFVSLTLLEFTSKF
jgi:hypothetical protein